MSPITLSLQAPRGGPETPARRRWTDHLTSVALSLAASGIERLWPSAQVPASGLAVYLVGITIALPVVVALRPDAGGATLPAPAGGAPRVVRPLGWVPPPHRLAVELMNTARLAREAQPRERPDEQDAIRQQLREAEARRSELAALSSRLLGERDDALAKEASLREILVERTAALAEARDRVRALEADEVRGSWRVGGAALTVRQRPPGRIPAGSEVRMFVSYAPGGATVARRIRWSAEGCGAVRLSPSVGSFIEFMPTRAGFCRVFLTYATMPTVESQDYRVRVVPPGG